MDIIKKINVIIESNKLRGFKSKKALGLEIEGMAMNVEAKDEKKFNAVLDKALKKIDSELSVVGAIEKLSDRDAVALYDALLDFHYMDD